MLSQIRKVQRGTLIVVTVIICIAFAFWIGKGPDPLHGSIVPLEVYGKTYRAPDLRALANRFSLAAFDLGRRDQRFQQFAYTLFGNRQDNDRSDFVIRLVTLEREARKLGIEPSSAEVEAAIQELSIFHNEAGKYDPSLRYDYVRNSLPNRFYFTEADLLAVISDFLKFRAIMDLVGAGSEPTDWEVTQRYRVFYEQFEVSTILLKQDTVTQDIEIKEDAIKAYYEEHKNELLGEATRGITYLTFPLPAEIKPAPPKEGSLTPPAPTPEEAANAAARNAVAKQFNEVFKQLQEAGEAAATKGQSFDFEAAAKNLLAQKVGNFTVVKTPSFTRTAPPKELEAEFQLLSSVFQQSLPQSMDSVEGTKSLYLFIVNEVGKPEPLAYEAAKAQVTEILKNQEIQSRLDKAIAEAKAKIEAELAKGVKIDDAAKAAGLEAVAVKPFSNMEPPGDDVPHADAIMEHVNELAAGKLSEPEDVEGGALLVYLGKRTLPERESSPEDLQRARFMLDTVAKNKAFYQWMTDRVADAKPMWGQIPLEGGGTRPIGVEEAISLIGRRQ